MSSTKDDPMPPNFILQPKTNTEQKRFGKGQNDSQRCPFSLLLASSSYVMAIQEEIQGMYWTVGPFERRTGSTCTE